MKNEGQPERAFAARPARIKTNFEVTVRCGACKFAARIVNLSGKGFGLCCARTLEPGCEVFLELPKVPPVKGVIRWVAGNDAGGLFMEAVAL
jgi:PilZ domain